MNESGSSKPRSRPPSILIVGGGLSGGLVAACLKHRRPDWLVTVVEKQPRVGGNHTWSFHGSDISARSWPWLLPLVSRSWASHKVKFPGFERVFDSSYHSIRSEDFHSQILASLGSNLLLSAEVVELGHRQVKLADGRLLEADAVIDARGADGGPVGRCGFQKFVGLDLKLANDHGLKDPIIMDARVPQVDGFRFFYVLPWNPNSLLVEDTRYSNSPALDEEALRADIFAYCLYRGWKVEEVSRAEKGVLPIPLEKPKRAKKTIGARSHSYQDTTGFTLPDGVRVAEAIAGIANLNPDSLESTLQKYERRQSWDRTFFRVLNRMLFWAARPADRYLVLQKFYTLPLPTIQRFYAGRITLADTARILSGKPPVPVWRGLAAAIGNNTEVNP